MRRWTTPLAILACVAGCHAKHEATTGKEFFEKMQKAAKDKDAETIWKMMSKKTQEAMVKSMKDQVEYAKKTAEMKTELVKMLKESTGIEGDPLAMDPEALAKAQLKKGLEKDSAKADKSKFIEEKKEGDLVILVIEEEGKDKHEIALIKEDGFLKMDMEALMNHKKK